MIISFAPVTIDHTRRIECANLNDMDELISVYCAGAKRTKSGKYAEKKYGKKYHKLMAEDQLTYAFRNNNCDVFKAVCNDNIIGLTATEICDKDHFRITHLYTQQERQGIGKDLMHHLFEYGQEKKMKKITLLAREEAMPFYRYFGFSEFGRKMTLYI